MKFLDYIQGYRKGKAANEIEQKSLTDPFLYDAIDGYDAVDGNHLEHIAEMEAKVKNRHLPSKSKRILRILVAAVFFLGIFGGYLFISEDTDYNNLMAYLDVTPEKNNLETQVAVVEKTEDLIQLEEAAPTEDLIHKSESTTEDALSEYKADDITAPIVEIDASELAEAYSTSSVDGMSEKKNVSVSSGDIVSRSQAREISKDPNISGNIGQGKKKLDNNKNQQLAQSLEENVIPPSVNKKTESSISISKENRNIASEKQNKPKKRNFDASEQSESNGNWLVGAGSSTTIDIEPANKPTNSLERISATNDNISKEKVSERSIPIIGQQEYNKYLRKSIKYPKGGKCSDINGLVIVEFNVTKTGRPINIKIAKSLCSELDQEAIRLVRAGSDWTTSNTSVRLSIEFDGDKKDK